MRGLLALLLLPLAFLLCAADTPRAEPAAIVEDVAPAVSKVRPMDILEAGQKLSLPDGTRLTLGYFRSCLRETITGSEVTIGLERSTVSGGNRKEELVDCNGGTRIISGKKGAEAAGAVFRKGASTRKVFPKPDWTLYGTAPVLRFSKSPQSVRIERLDREESPVHLEVSGNSLDAAASGVALDPGGLYALTSGKIRYILKISPLAVPDAPLLSRLVPM